MTAPSTRDADEAVDPDARDVAALFTEHDVDVGLDFVHFNGMTGDWYMVETLGPGGALFDADGDGDLDVYLVQGAMLDPARDPSEAIVPAPRDLPPRDRLFRNAIADSGRLTFTDATDALGIRSTGCGLGVASGDYDSDGDVDLYVTNLGSNVLLRNDDGRAFVDVTTASGTDDDRFSASAAFVDVDRDGLLDLFVANYVDFNLGTHKACWATSSARDWCGPSSFHAQPDSLFVNRGDGSFADASASSGIALEYGNALGVVVGDVDDDGWPDLYVANDAMPNQLWMNRHDGRFSNEALLGGCAVNADGMSEASMGVDLADADGDGDDDLFMTHLGGETNTLYRNDGGVFTDVTKTSGLGASSLGDTGFGTAWFDQDGDGLLDLLVANGAVQVLPELLRLGDPYPLHQPNRFHRNLGELRFEDVTALAGPALKRSEVSRGAAFGDVDGDGDPDVLLLNNNGRARLLLNTAAEQPDANGWISLAPVTRAGGTPQLGAKVDARLDDGRILVRRVRASGSYCSASDPRVLLGLGPSAKVVEVVVQWTDGTRERFGASELGHRTQVELLRGTGEAVP